MGRAPCCDKANVKRGPWSPEEDSMLKNYIERYGTGGNWIALPQKAGLKRCGKSCRLRWLNYLRPNIKHGEFSDEEDSIIFNLFINIGSRWSIIAAQLPGRTDNDIKNYWNTKLKKKLMGLLPNHLRKPQQPSSIPLPQPRTSTPPHHPQLFLPSSFHIQPSQQQLAQPQAAVSPYYHSYINNYPSTSDNNGCTTPTTTATTSSVATVNSVLNSCYEPFSMKDQEFLDFGSDPRSCNSHGNQQMMLGMMIKQEEVVVHHDGFEFESEYDQRNNEWAGTMSDFCFGTEFDLISGRGTNLIDHNQNHHGINKLGEEEMGLYYGRLY